MGLGKELGCRTLDRRGKPVMMLPFLDRATSCVIGVFRPVDLAPEAVELRGNDERAPDAALCPGPPLRAPQWAGGELLTASSNLGLTEACLLSRSGLAFAASPGVEKEEPTPLQADRKEQGSTGHHQSGFAQGLAELSKWPICPTVPVLPLNDLVTLCSYFVDS